MAPTGTTAFSMGSPTIHSALLMPKFMKTYIKLSDDKCNTLRAKLRSLQMVVLDEISMVGNNMLVYISKRLQQITGISKPFRGITVLAFGDLYQLPPVGQRKITSYKKEIIVYEGSRVMVIRYIDVQDGLCNGAQVTVLSFLPKTTNGKVVKAVVVQVDKPNVRSAAIAASKFDLSAFPANPVPITTVEISFSVSRNKQRLEIRWIQFPLQLAFGCTTHKIQGSTLDNVFVSFKNSFFPGQANVALSRSRTLEGLQLLD